MDKNDISRIIEMAWEDRTPFDAIKKQFGLNEDALKKLMRKNRKVPLIIYGENVFMEEKLNILVKEIF